MKCLLLVLSLGLPALGIGSEPQVVFEDALHDKLGPGWEWLREHSGFWRSTPKGLEIRVERSSYACRRRSASRS